MTKAPSYYIYLISSLPMLHFGMKPPFSFEKFLKMCDGLVPSEDIETIEKIGQADLSIERLSVEKRWRAFDTMLRNALVKIRSGRKKLDPQKYLRGGLYADPQVTQIAINACRNPSVIEAERMLDRERWRVLDDLAIGHYFDMEFLALYGRKLMMLERWERIGAADKSRLLAEAIGA